MIKDMKVVMVGIITAVVVIKYVYSSKSSESDEENILRQALYLVKLLKTDYMKSLRENNEIVTSDTDESNSTCPEADFNTTTPTLYSVPVRAPPPPGTMKPVIFDSPPRPMVSFSHPAVRSVPSAQIAYDTRFTTDIIMQQSIRTNFPSHIQSRPTEYIPPVENYNYPYRRRMMPAYDYYGELRPRFGYRRQGDGLPETNETAGTETTEVTVTNKPISVSTKSSEHTTAITTKSAETRLRSSSTMRILSRSTKRPHNTMQAAGKASKVDIWMDRKQFKKDNVTPPRTMREKPSGEDHVLSEVASELLNEIKGTKTEKMTVFLKQSINNDDMTNNETPIFHKSTMKIFLKGSSRMQIPFPENNAFCHLYPHNRLCGAGI